MANTKQNTLPYNPDRTLGSVFHVDELQELDRFERRTEQNQARRVAETEPVPVTPLFARLERIKLGRLAAVGALVGVMAVAGIRYNMTPGDQIRAVFPDDQPPPTQPAQNAQEQFTGHS